MKTYVVRQPIISQEKETFGYEILYPENAASLFNQEDTDAANVIESFLSELDTSKFLEGKTAFLTFTPNLLMKNIPKIFSSDHLVIQIEDNSVIHPLAQKIIYRFKKQGYRIALKGFTFNSKYFSVLDIVDFIKVDFAQERENSIRNIVSMAESFQKQIIAYNISTQEHYDLARSLECRYLQGSYVAQAQSSRVSRVDHMQSNFFMLVVAITKEEPDIDEITEIISRDVSLAFSLIKLVNSAYFALRNQVKSVKQALVVLGLGQLKQWIYLLSFKNDNGQLPDALIKISFLRANFCARVTDYVKTLPVSHAEAYLMGMFSTLGTLLEVPLVDALDQLPISDDIKAALLDDAGDCGLVYKLIRSYEAASWQETTETAVALGIPVNVVSQIYFECVEYVNEIWESLNSIYDEHTSGEEQTI